MGVVSKAGEANARLHVFNQRRCIHIQICGQSVRNGCFGSEAGCECLDALMLVLGSYSTLGGSAAQDAVCVIDTDISVDFAAPLDYVEPSKPRAGSGATIGDALAAGIPGISTTAPEEKNESKETEKEAEDSEEATKPQPGKMGFGASIDFGDDDAISTAAPATGGGGGGGAGGASPPAGAPPPATEEPKFSGSGHTLSSSATSSQQLSRGELLPSSMHYLVVGLWHCGLVTVSSEELRRRRAEALERRLKGV